ncbi:histidine phosphatase family protein [Bradyrhizobium sp. INPA01-394B]|uniref:Histidine phosphatase family protein n=1 Tax=Bradyrhizobium campsiandrae TaxID=1729892 RepID=A0ABR7U5K6_9BRAD|nr:histidine phosphatase family protein [Bradyrhizobium campsiandrae]MBC9876741.1 histidine phosphatase family protein [Bradyrhizobium campsiandrae]MBC9979255.1 histidine phosphatase family protein [Bradyrhizobium campsiandrae]
MEGETFLWLIRHAPVDGVAGTIHAMDAPADLGDRAQLEALRSCLPRGAASYASPARRTVETARALGLAPELVPEFGEQDFGDWTGRKHDELAAAGGEAYADFWCDPAHGRPPGGESFKDQIARVQLGLTSVNAGAATLVVHSGTIRAALCIALDLTPQAALRFVIDPLSLTRIDRLATGWRIVSVNQQIS